TSNPRPCRLRHPTAASAGPLALEVEVHPIFFFHHSGQLPVLFPQVIELGYGGELVGLDVADYLLVFPARLDRHPRWIQSRAARLAGPGRKWQLNGRLHGSISCAVVLTTPDSWARAAG